jgi:hypothetical protein
MARDVFLLEGPDYAMYFSHYIIKLENLPKFQILYMKGADLATC